MQQKTSRRRFISGLAAATAGAVVWSDRLRAQTAPAAPTNVRLVTGGRDSDPGSGPKPLLVKADFRYLGYYDVLTWGGDSAYGQGLTHRYVNGQLRFMTLDWNRYTGPIGDTGYIALHEFTVANAPMGGLVDTLTNTWVNPYGDPKPMQGQYFGLWWEEAKQRLWTTDAVDYQRDYIPTQITTRTLNADGTVSNLRKVSLEGIPDRRVFGGAQAVPTWFQQRYGVGPYVVGWGGYTSLVAQGGAASLGPAAYAIPQPENYADGATIPKAAFKTLSDCSSGTGITDWYLGTGATAPTSFDRGVRITHADNYFDANDPRPNPPTPPVVPPTPGNWVSPAPDGLGRWTWTDTHLANGCWIDGPNKHGFLMLPNLGGGKLWYGASAGHCDFRQFEMHIYDPVRFGEAAGGSRAPWNVKPTNLWEEKFDGLGNTPGGGPGPGCIFGTTYDSVSQRLYCLGMAAGTNNANRLYVYQVNS